jgi:cytochrome c-type biogenesis protein CcmH/NrfG
MYFAHLPGMLAAGDIIDGFRTAEPMGRLNAFKQAIDRNSFAHQEITEQLSQQVIAVMRTQTISPEIKTAYITYVEEQFERLLREKPGDARIEVFIGSFYRTVNDLEKATVHMQRAHELSPGKPSIIVQQGVIELSRGDNTKALEYMLKAYELDTRNPEAREYLAIAYLANKDQEKAFALMDSDVLKDRFARNDYLISVANKAGMYDFGISLLEHRVAQDSAKAQNWASLAYLYIQSGQKDKALETLEKGAVAAPSFATMASCVSENIKKGSETPDEGC